MPVMFTKERLRSEALRALCEPVLLRLAVGADDLRRCHDGQSPLTAIGPCEPALRPRRPVRRPPPGRRHRSRSPSPRRSRPRRYASRVRRRDTDEATSRARICSASVRRSASLSARVAPSRPPESPRCVYARRPLSPRAHPCPPAPRRCARSGNWRRTARHPSGSSPCAARIGGYRRGNGIADAANSD